jgi:hypothetical protein
MATSRSAYHRSTIYVADQLIAFSRLRIEKISAAVLQKESKPRAIRGKILWTSIRDRGGVTVSGLLVCAGTDGGGAELRWFSELRGLSRRCPNSSRPWTVLPIFSSPFASCDYLWCVWSDAQALGGYIASCDRPLIRRSA